MKKIFTFLALISSVVVGYASEYVVLDSPYDNHTIEVVIQTPASEEGPLLLFLHGASKKDGLTSIAQSWFDRWLDKGYTAAAISMPGFGGSSGRMDFCGPFTLDSLNFAIDAIKDKLNVSNFGIIGFGQGGMAGVLLASQRDDIHCVVCANGGYDLVRHMVPGDPLMQSLKKKGYDIDTDDQAALAIRSPLLHISTIQAPLFLLHRVDNPIVSEDEVVDFCHAMQASGKVCELRILEKTSETDVQKIFFDEVIDESEDWVDGNMQT